MLDNSITIVGQLTDDPELRFTPNGHAVVSVRIASSRRVLDQTTNEYKDVDKVFINATAWRQFAENIAESFTKGNRVIVVGRYKQRPYETEAGDKRIAHEIEIEEMGPSVKYAVAKPQRANSATQGQGTAASSPPSAPAAAAAPAATQAPATQPAAAPAAAAPAGYEQPPF